MQGERDGESTLHVVDYVDSSRCSLKLFFFSRCLRSGDISRDQKDATRAAGEPGHALLQSHREISESRRHQLPNGDRTANRAELRKTLDESGAVHLRGQRVEGVFLVGAALEQRERRIDAARSELAECYMRRRTQILS